MEGEEQDPGVHGMRFLIFLPPWLRGALELILYCQDPEYGEHDSALGIASKIRGSLM